MKFPNAAKGIKKIYSAEIMKLVSYICLIVAAVIGVIAIAAATGTGGSDTGLAVFAGGVGAVVLVIAFIVLLIISFIMNLVGFINASHDGDSFKTALIFLILGIIMSALSGFFTAKNSGVGNVFYSLSTLSDTLATIFVIAGGVKLADRLNVGEVSRKGSNVLKLIIVVEIITFIVSFISTFMGGVATSIVSAVLLLTAFILSFIKYIMYLSFLSQAKKMLMEN